MNLANPTGKILDALLAANLPVAGVNSDLSVAWTGTPTQAQLDQAKQIAAATDVRTRRAKALARAIQDVAALSAVDRNTLMTGMLAMWVTQYPTAPRKLGVALDGDEVDVGG